MKIKISILDEGRSIRPPKNWKSYTTESGDLQLWIDGEYICALNIEDNDIIAVSTDHKIELKEQTHEGTESLRKDC